jgi:hypothetical protein
MNVTFNLLIRHARLLAAFFFIKLFKDLNDLC